MQLHYAVGGMLVAVRDSGTGAVTYLHSDHLGSVSLATANSGSGPSVASEQLFTPWGQVRAGGIGQTSHNYTGQRLDGSGLLYYHARYYDPALARFVSADSVVPGSASGSMDGVALKPLTVDFHEPGFAATLHEENQQKFWFQLSTDEQKDEAQPAGPTNPQALNRYAYVQNNPLRYTDPTGHITYSLGVTFSIRIPYGGVSYGGGVTWDDKGNVKLYETTSIGPGVSASIGTTFSGSVTNADTIHQTEGRGSIIGVDLTGPVAGVDVIVGPKGLRKDYKGLGISVGPSLGAGGHIERTNTTLRDTAELNFPAKLRRVYNEGKQALRRYACQNICQ